MRQHERLDLIPGKIKKSAKADKTKGISDLVDSVKIRVKLKNYFFFSRNRHEAGK